MTIPYGYKKAIFCFLPVLYNPVTNDITGRGIISNCFLDIAIPMYQLFLFITGSICNFLDIDYEPTYRIRYKKDKK